jgi:phosphoribosylanthranilate isomerase
LNPLFLTPTPIIQIAGFREEEEVAQALHCGATHVGFPFVLPVHREDCTVAQAGQWVRRLKQKRPSGWAPVLITYATEATIILDLLNQLECQLVQLHGEAPESLLRTLRHLRPEVVLIKSVMIKGEEDVCSLVMAQSWLPWVDAVLTDSFDPLTGALGATGLVHDWCQSRSLVESLPVPVILAGGLRPDNVSDAIMKVRPFGVDVHTGVEDAHGRKSLQLMASFCDAARTAYGSGKGQ